MNTDAKNPLLSFDATPLERIALIKIAEALNDVKRLARDARLQQPEGFCGQITLTRVFTDILSASIAGNEGDHETLGEDVKNWMCDGLEFWRNQVAKNKAEQETVAAKLNAEFGKLFGGL